jgi:hypothetical protein
MHAIDGLLKRFDKEQKITITEAPEPEDNCIMGWSALVINDEDVFWNQLAKVVTSILCTQTHTHK